MEKSPPERRTRVRLKVGDRVRYIGSIDYLQRQYAGILTIVRIERGLCTCEKPTRRYTSWIEPSDLAIEITTE